MGQWQVALSSASTANRQPQVTSHVARTIICRAGLAFPPVEGGGEGPALTLLWNAVQLLEREAATGRFPQKGLC